MKEYSSEEKKKLLKNRPAFHVDQYLKEAAKKAAQVFKEEEEELKKLGYGKV